MTGYESKKAAAQAKVNPPGGPAKVVDAMAAAIRAGDDYHAPLGIYGYAKQQPTDAPSATYQEIADSMNMLRQGTPIQTQVYKEMKNKKLYFGPPQRTWVGLTDEEREEIALELPIDAVRITEAKLKEKNT
jgi:hypothetical protein